MFKELQGQTRQIYGQCVEIAYLMRGAVSLDRILESTPFERELMGAFLSNHLEKEVKKPHPNY